MCCHTIELEMVVVRNHEIDVTDLDGEKVMMDLEKGNYFTLNKVASTIWDMMEEPISLNQIVHQLRQIYAVDEKECQTAVQTFIHQMIHANAVELQN